MSAETNGVHDSYRTRPDHPHRSNGMLGPVLGVTARPNARGHGSERGAAAEGQTCLPRIEAPRTWYGPVKRCFDLFAVLVLAVPTLLIVAVAGAFVKLGSRGPMLYSQMRVGRGGRSFRIWKLRSMVHNCEKESGPRWATALDARITPLGRVLRKYHIDELPQLWNILVGDMSLVGPRPERPEFVPLLAEAVPDYPDRLAVQPGMTGLAQVQLPPDTDVASVHCKLKYDRYYVVHCGFWLDFRILATTAYYLVQIPYNRVADWLRVPCANVVEVVEDDEPAPYFPPRHSKETQVLSETCVVAQQRGASR